MLKTWKHWVIDPRITRVRHVGVSDMAEREPVTDAGYRLEPSSVLKSCTPATLQT